MMELNKDLKKEKKMKFKKNENNIDPFIDQSIINHQHKKDQSGKCI